MTVMSQPTQDTDISSSFIPIDILQNNDYSRNIYIKEISMDGESKMTLPQKHTNCTDTSDNYERQNFQNNESTNTKLSEETFPWLTKFNKVMCSSAGSRSYPLLECLLSVCIQNVLTSVNIYYIKTSEVIKIKGHLNNTLTFFHFYWHDIKEHVTDCESYLNKMSMLLGIYIDMELKSYRHSKDSSKIAAKILSTLWIYLNNSEKHIFRVLLRLKLISKKYTKVYNPIFMTSFKRLRRNMDPITDVNYVRTLLVLKLWKKIKENLEEKKKVNKLALLMLGPHMPKMRDELLNIIPKPPVDHKNQTIWLLQPNVFDLKKACDRFVAFEEAMSNTNVNDYQRSQITPRYNMIYSQEYPGNHQLIRDQTTISYNKHSFENARNSNKSTGQVHRPTRRSKFEKYKPISKLKPGEVILIDLTQEDDSARINDSKKKKKRSTRKLEWLKMMRKRYKAQKEVDILKSKSQVEIADAHSTETSEDFTDKVLEYLPISDNKVSESTESCALLQPEKLQNSTIYVNSIDAHDCNKRNKDLKYGLQRKCCDICTLSLKQEEMQQHNRALCLMKLLNFVGQNIKDPKVFNLIRESKEQNFVCSQPTFFDRNTANTSNGKTTQSKEESFPQQKNCIDLSKECQNNIRNTHLIKQELPTSTDYNVTEADTYCQNESVYVQNVDCHFNNYRTLSNHSLQITDVIKQKVPCNVPECARCCKRVDIRSFPYHGSNVFNAVKSEDSIQNVDDNVSDTKSISDKNIQCMLSDLDKCMDVLNRIGEHIMSVHAEKQRVEYLNKTDVCAVSTTVFGDRMTKSSLGCWTKDINLLTNSEKLNRILELYGKKEFLNACDCKDYKMSGQESIVTSKPVEQDVKSFNNMTIPISESEALYPYDSEASHTVLSLNKLPQNFVSGHIKSEIKESLNDEDTAKNSEGVNEHKNSIVTNTQLHSIESMFELKDIEDDSNKNITGELSVEDASQTLEITKTNTLDEFENIDILDSILNGDMTMDDDQEILEDSQSSMMSPVGYDNSSNVLNCITDFFTHSDHAYASKKEPKYVATGTENSLQPLPEGSLGTTGILNSLLDFDLTNMDSPPNDFMYSNVQTVNPRLIKKNVEEKICSITTNDDFTELQFKDQIFSAETSDTENVLLQKENKSCNKHSSPTDSSVDIVEFGLHNNNEETLEFPSLIRNISSFSDHSTVLFNTDIVPSVLKESTSKYTLPSPTEKLNRDSTIEHSYIFQKEDTIEHVQSLSNVIQNSSFETTTSNTSTNLLTNCLSNKSIGTPLQLKTSSSNQTDFCNALSSINLISCTTTVPQGEFFQRKNLQKQSNIQEDTEQKQSRAVKHRLEVNEQCRSYKRKLRHRKIKREKGEQDSSSTIQTNSNKLSLRYSEVAFNPMHHQDVQTISESLTPSFHVPCRQKSPCTMCTSKSTCKQLKCVGFQQLRHMSRTKQHNVENLRGKPTANVILQEDSKMENNQTTVNSDISEDSSGSFKSANKNLSRARSCFKFCKRNIKLDTNITEVNLGVDKHVTEISNSSRLKPRAKCLVQVGDTQSSKFTRKQQIVTSNCSSKEDSPLKKRKLTSKFLPVLEADTLVCSMNQQESQEKCLVSIKTDFMCTSRQKNAVVR